MDFDEPKQQILKKRKLKLKFSWKNLEHLKEAVMMAGKRYYEEAEKIQGINSSAKMFSAVTRSARGLPIDASLEPFVRAFKNLDDLKEKCVFEHNLHISLVSLSSLPSGKNFDVERKLREENFARSKRRAKK